MSDKKGSSNLPSGPIDLGYASSYGIDSLVPVHDRNEGPLDKARLPEAKGISGLPEGILADPEVPHTDLPDGVETEHMVIGMLDEGLMGQETPRLVDLHWLEDATQDPDRLPQSPHDKMIPELTEEWGVGRRTDGVHFYNDLPQTSVQTTKSLPVLSVQDMARKAMREIASGADAKDTLGQLPENIRSVVASEIGLNGKVFIRAEAYTNCDSGKWNDTVRKTASSAEYLIAKKACSGCVRNINGSCEMFGKKVVTSVPWKEAYSKYASRLKTAGHKVLNTGDFQQDLKNSFLAGPHKAAKETAFPILPNPSLGVTLGEAFEGLKGIQSQVEVLSKEARDLETARKLLKLKLAKWFDGRFLTRDQYDQLSSSKADPKAIMKAASHLADLNTVKSSSYNNPSGFQKAPEVTAEQAWGSLKQAEAQHLEKSKAVLEKLSKDLRSRVSELTQTGLISEGEASLLLKNTNIRDMVRNASELISNKLASPQGLRGSPVKTAAYSGVGTAQKIREASDSEVQETLRTREEALRHRDAQVKNYIQTKKSSAVSGYVDSLQRAGILSEKDIAGLDMSGSSDAVLVRIANLVSAKANRPRQIEYKGSKTSSYSGEGVDAVFGRDEKVSFGDAWKSLTKTSRNLVASPSDLRGVLKFAKEHMNEGVAGKSLDQLLEARFSAPLLKAAEDMLSAEREKHEGLAGHLYVDSELYSTPSGTTGCEKGAMKHRANAVPYVLSMSKCASCVFKNANNTCQKYNKELVSSVSSAVDDVVEYQMETIKLANATEQERVQSIFAPVSNMVEEFGLGKKATDFDLDPEAEYNGLDGVIFGDFDLE